MSEPLAAQPQAYAIPQVGGSSQPAPYEAAPQYLQQPQSAPGQYAQPQYSQPQYAQSQLASAPGSLPQNGQYAPLGQAAYAGVPVHMIAYPQDQVPPPNNNGNNGQQQPEQVWPAEQVGQQPLQQGIPQPMPLQPDGTPVIPGAPYNGSAYADPYAQTLAPGAVGAQSIVEGSGAACGGAVAGSPITGAFSSVNNYMAKSSAWLGNYYGVPGKAWFVGGGALLMRRVDDNNVALAYDGNMPTDNVLRTRDARQQNLNGFEVFTGRYFNCGRNALMLSYWGLYPSTQTATIAGGTDYMPWQPFTNLDLQGTPVYDWYHGAYAQRLVRSSNYQNVEGNLLGFAVGGAARTWGPGGCGGGCGAYTGPCSLTPNVCGSRCNWTWLAGVRWFQFTDKLQYAASGSDANFNGGADDVYYDNNVTNNLVGFQLGGVGNYCVGRRLNLYALSKAGIYNNHSHLYSRIGTNGGNPEAATITALNAYNGNDYLVNATQNNAAFLGEIGTGLGWRISRGWSANVGYRV
ncbi:MAG: hypothetical protein ACTHK7_05930, partial [Aureliella sp.]